MIGIRLGITYLIGRVSRVVLAVGLVQVLGNKLLVLVQILLLLANSLKILHMSKLLLSSEQAFHGLEYFLGLVVCKTHRYFLHLVPLVD